MEADSHGSDKSGRTLKDSEASNSQSDSSMSSARPGTKLNDSVYEFYRPDGEFSVEIVAFHGLRFSDYRDAYETTWEVENGSGSWLRDFLPRSFPESRILSVSYDSCAKVSDQAGRMSFSNLGMILVQDIIHLAKVGQQGCPVLLVGYCLGGLVIKQLCTEAEKQYDQAPDGSSKGRLDHFLMNVRGIFFMDTPEAGSALGKHLRETYQCKGPVLEYLEDSSRDLGKLTTEFESLVNERDWKAACLYYLNITTVWDSLLLPKSGEPVVQEASARVGKKISVTCVAGVDHSVRALGSARMLDYADLRVLNFIEDTIERNQSKTPKPPHRELNRGLRTIVREEQVGSSLYEMYGPVAEQDAKLELIFFPGSCEEESYKTTWMAKDNKHCWLQTWLPNAFPEARILAVSYSRFSPDYDLYCLCESLRWEIIRYRRKRPSLPLILVGHCLGGLIIKDFCNQLEMSALRGDNLQHNLQELLWSIRGIAYYGTSHVGYDHRYKGMFEGDNNIECLVRQLYPTSVARSNHDLLYGVYGLGWKELALGETQPVTLQGSRKIVFVDEFSASFGIQRNSFFPVAADHVSICKPESPLSNSFQYLVHFIDTTIKEAQYRNMNVRRKKRRGLAVTICMGTDRPGSDSDLRRLESTADYLNFDTRMVLNNHASELPSIIGKILEEVNEEDECLLCCVSAHGAVLRDEKSERIQHYIFDKKDEMIQVAAILKPIAVATVLKGKPKVFVVNACRVEKGNIGDTSGLPQEQNDLHGIDDCLLMYSTRLYKESFRRETGNEPGTLLISELAYQISLLYQTTDVQDIFEKVKERVPELAKKLAEEERKQSPELGKLYEREQFPELYSSLTKRLSWRPR